MPHPPVTTPLDLIESWPTPAVLTTSTGTIVAMSPTARAVMPTATVGSSIDVAFRKFEDPPTATRQEICLDDVPHLVVVFDSAPINATGDEGVAHIARETAHDFNNLLGVIINYATLAAAQLPADHSAAADLHEVLGASRRAATITRRLLQIASGGEH